MTRFVSRDWKKLTFYYFADSYINFNSLVTDLFKIYKTRIWMSAINPASFATPTAGLHPPGHGPMAFGQEPHADRRRQHDFKPYGMGGLNQGLPQGVFSDQTNRDVLAAQGAAPVRAPYIDPYQAFNIGERPDANLAGFPSGLQPQSDPFTSFPPSNYGALDPSAPEYGPIANVMAGGVRRVGPAQNDWVSQQFQGLSLGS
jgi:hypothetical protein